MALEKRVCVNCCLWNDPGAETCSHCRQVLPPVQSLCQPAEDTTESGGRIIWEAVLCALLLGGVPLLVIASFVHGYLTRHPDHEVVTVSVAQVEARPAAHLRYPGSLLVATNAMTGTTILDATYAKRGYGRSATRVFTGYSGDAASPGTLKQFFTSDATMSQVRAWYRRDLLGRGWEAGGTRSSGGLTVMTFTYDGAMPEQITLLTGDPQQVTDLAGQFGRTPPVGRTLFAATYALYPDGTWLLPLD